MLAAFLLVACGGGAGSRSAPPDAAEADGAASPVTADAAPIQRDATAAPELGPSLDAPGSLDVPGSPDAPVALDVPSSFEAHPEAPIGPEVGAVMDLGVPQDGPAADASDPSTKCSGSYPNLNRGQLGSMTSLAGACAKPGDLDLVCTGGLATIAGACGLACLMMPSPAIAACTSGCLQDQAGVSPGCADCYGQTIACTQANCLNQCIANPAAPACLQCQIDKGCRSAFRSCTGLP
jgi:hypothetical protein